MVFFHVFDKRNEHELKESLNTFQSQIQSGKIKFFEFTRITKNVLTQFPNQGLAFFCF